MKLHEKSSCRFAKEYANYKISILKDIARCHPENTDAINGRIIYIERRYQDWKNGYMMTDEMMRLIAEA